MRYIWCILGFHKWRYFGRIPDWERECWKCKKKQMASYDMSYGETIWENINGN